MTKYQRIYDRLARDILTGRLQPGQKAPSEAALAQRFSVSRITAIRALNELEQRGLVERIAGSGTFVRARSTGSRDGLMFGLIIPQLGETEIFEPICHGIASSPLASEHALLWPQSNSHRGRQKAQALHLCRQCIDRGVNGVFFAPLERADGAEAMNQRILTVLERADIPVVLLDRRPETPSSTRPDLVGIDNQQAGYVATEHLLRSGAQRICFVGYSHAALTIKTRRTGYREALAAYGAQPGAEHTDLVAAVREERVDGFVCGNDRIAGELMHRLLAEKIKVPEHVRMVGIDDVNYARLLPVPLTTVRQPCRHIGEMALQVMLERLERPKAPARDVLLSCELVVRRSCGSKPD